MAPRSSEMWSRRSLTKDPDGWSATRVFQVTGATSETNALAATPLDGSDRIPGVNDGHPENFRLKAKTITPKREGIDYYVVTVEYVIPELGAFDRDAAEDPLGRELTIEFQNANRTEPVDRDVFGNPIVNSALEAFSPPPSRNFAYEIVTIKRNEPYYDRERLKPFLNRINDKKFVVKGRLIGEAGTVKVKNISPVSEIKDSDEFVRMAYVFEVQDDGFGARFMDQGFRRWLEASEEEGAPDQDGFYPIVDEQTGQPPTRPVLLNGFGARLIIPLDAYRDSNTPNRLPPEVLIEREGKPIGELEPGVGLPPVFLTYQLNATANLDLLELNR